MARHWLSASRRRHQIVTMVFQELDARWRTPAQRASHSLCSSNYNESYTS